MKVYGLSKIFNGDFLGNILLNFTEWNLRDLLIKRMLILSVELVLSN